jgi:hypothetical protein
MKDRKTNDKNGQLVTRAKSKRADSGNLKCNATNKIYRRLTVLCPVPVDMSFKEIEVALVGGIFTIPPLNILRIFNPFI